MKRYDAIIVNHMVEYSDEPDGQYVKWQDHQIFFDEHTLKFQQKIELLQEEIEKKNQWIADVYNLFYEVLSSKIFKYTHGYHTRDCKSVEDWRVTQDCSCIMGNLIDLMNKISTL